MSENGAGRRDIYRQVTDSILADLKAGVAPWVKPWSGGGAAGVAMPYNAASNRDYSGTNVLALWGRAMAAGYDVPGWLTFKQAADLGAHVRKGERGTLVVYARTIRKTETDAETGEDRERSFPVLKGYFLFNVRQCEGLPERMLAQPAAQPEPERLAHVEAFIAATRADIRHGGDRAFYAPGPDCIGLPPAGAFRSIGDYHATALHELVHWSGAAQRLAREKGLRFGDQRYAAEELVAELGAAFLCAKLELGVRVAELWSRREWRLRMIREGRWQHPKCMGSARRVYFAPAFEGGA